MPGVVMGLQCPAGTGATASPGFLMQARCLWYNGLSRLVVFWMAVRPYESLHQIKKDRRDYAAVFLFY